MSGFVYEKPRNTPVVWEGDLVVVGGGVTGVFAAVRAARLGLRVAIVEKQNLFGGTATSGLVYMWHSLYDFDLKEQIISGLSEEVIDRLDKDGQVDKKPWANPFNPMALIRVLDLLVTEHRITPFLHTMYAGISSEDGKRVQYVFVENKDGRGALKAEFFIDASGDGDLCRDLGLPRYSHGVMQPPSYCFFMKGNTTNDVIEWAVRNHGAEFGLEDDWGWYGEMPGQEGLSFRADNHVFGYDLSKAEDLSEAEIEGRRRAFMFEAMLRKYVSPEYRIVNIASTIGIRETVHYKTRFQANETDLLTGVRYEDAVMQGTYGVDIHHEEDNGITFKDLDGSLRIEYGKGCEAVEGNWRHDMGLDDNYARFYQVPFSVLVQEQYDNLIPVGRMINADKGAFGALRVMLNLNQLGEAAGVAAALSLNGGLPVRELSGIKVREVLREGGSCL